MEKRVRFLALRIRGDCLPSWMIPPSSHIAADEDKTCQDAIPCLLPECRANNDGCAPARTSAGVCEPPGCNISFVRGPLHRHPPSGSFLCKWRFPRLPCAAINPALLLPTHTPVSWTNHPHARHTTRSLPLQSETSRSFNLASGVVDGQSWPSHYTSQRSTTSQPSSRPIRLRDPPRQLCRSLCKSRQARRELAIARYSSQGRSYLCLPIGLG